MNKKQWKKEAKYWENAYNDTHEVYVRLWDSHMELLKEVKQLKGVIEEYDLKQEMSAEYDSDDCIERAYNNLLVKYNKLKEEVEELEGCLAVQAVKELDKVSEESTSDETYSTESASSCKPLTYIYEDPAYRDKALKDFERTAEHIKGWGEGWVPVDKYKNVGPVFGWEIGALRGPSFKVDGRYGEDPNSNNFSNLPQAGSFTYDADTNVWTLQAESDMNKDSSSS